MNRLSHRGTGAYVLRRLLQLIPLLLGITLLSFALMRLAAGDAVDMLYENLGTSVSQEVLDARRAELGLDQPFFVQYFTWLGGVLRGDMGVSYVSGQPVFETFCQKLPNTLLLAGASLILTVVIAVPLGILSAVRRGRWIDHLLRFLSLLGNSMPNFFVALLLLLLFAVKLQWLPSVNIGTGLTGLILPSVTLAIAMASRYTRQVRAAVLEELGQDYVTGARARGVRESAILWRSVLKTAMMTIVTLLALSLGSLLGGTAIVESIFLWDGIGQMAVDAISMRDYPIILSYVMWTAIIYVLVNLAADLIYRHLDPRVRLGEEVLS